MTDWIPIDRIIIDIYRTYEVMWSDGSKSIQDGSIICKNTAVAVRVLPPERKRREFYVDPKCRGHINIAETIDGECHSRYELHLKEVLPGDCDPDVVRDVVAEMRSKSSLSAPTILKWADRLEGKI